MCEEGKSMAGSEEAIIQFVAGLDESGTPISGQSQLLETGLLDSINLVQLIQFVEERFGIDAALVWPLCRETFSFTAYEAAAAGAAVLTNPDSGNVATFVAEGGHGRVLADEAALIALFESGEALELARAARRPTLYGLDFGALTAELRAGPEAGPASGSR